MNPGVARPRSSRQPRMPMLVPRQWRASARLRLGRAVSEPAPPSVTHRISHGKEHLWDLLVPLGQGTWLGVWAGLLHQLLYPINAVGPVLVAWSPECV